MRNTSFESFIRFGGSSTITLNASYRHGLEVKQEAPGAGDAVDNWVEAAWSMVYGATAQAIMLCSAPQRNPKTLNPMNSLQRVFPSLIRRRCENKRPKLFRRR